MSLLDAFKKKITDADFSKEVIEAFFAEEENDPLSGLGSLTKRDKVIDKIIAHHNLVVAKYRNVMPKMPAPLLKETTAPEAPLDLKAAQLAKKAGM